MEIKPKCPTCDSHNIFLYSDEYSTVWQCNNCGELFDMLTEQQREVF